MLLRSIKSLDFGSITLEVSRREADPGSVKRLGIVNASFVQAASQLAEMDAELENLRIRIVASYNKSSSQVIDFITQRINEYLLMEKRHRSFRLEHPADQYINFLRSDLEQNASYLKKSSPMSPYSTQRELIPRMFRNKFADSNVPEGTIFYDIPLVEILPRDGQGNIIRRAAESTDPAVIAVRPEAHLADENMDWSEIFISLVSRVSTQNLQRVYLEPVVFDFGQRTESDLEQLTFYMFIYDSAFAGLDDDFELPEISLVTGMTASRTATVIGNRYSWPRITQTTPNRGPGKLLQNGDYLEAKVTVAPQASIFQRIDLNPQNIIIERVNSMFDRVYGSLSRTILDDKPEMKKIIKRDNFFSELWMTRDSDENNRFMFAFDLESCLIKNSYFPFLYRSKNISNQLINGKGLMSGPENEPSRPLRMNVICRSVSKDAMRPINDLSTSGRVNQRGPDYTFPEKVVGEAIPVTDIFIDQERSDGTKNKIIFFEGKDRLDNREEYPIVNNSQINGNFVYGVEYVVYDAAPIFMRNMILFLMNRKHTVADIFSTIINSVPTPRGYIGGVVNDGRDLYNPETRTLNVPLNNIKGTINGQVQEFDQALLGAATEYQRLLDDLNPFAFENSRINISAFYQQEFTKNGGRIDPLVIKDLEKLMDVGIQIIYRKLTEIFPNDPLGRGLAHDQDSKLQRRGFCQRKVPLIVDQHFFDIPFPKGENFGYGTDYIFNRESNRTQKGLSRISLTEYTRRVDMEFQKYFQEVNGRRLAPVGSFLDPAYAYMTSRVIRTPDRDTMHLPAAGGQRNPVVRYNLNRYAQLFADITNMNYFIKNRRVSPMIADSNPSQTANNILYDSIIQALEEQHCVEFSSTPEPQFNPSKISTGKLPPTTEGTSSLFGSYIFRNGPLAIPSLTGGGNNTDPTTLTYFADASKGLSNISGPKINGNLDKIKERERFIKRPIKLPFAILGELTVDSDIDLEFSYEDIRFNSLKEFLQITHIENNSLRSVLQDTFVSNLPNQVKSAIIVAATTQENRFGNEIVQFDACRPILADKDLGEEDRATNTLISFSDNSPNEPPYSSTYDPMKIYAKFLTFWLNYKQIAKIEYLNGFNNLSQEEDFSTDVLQVSVVDNALLEKTKLPEWRILSQEVISTAVKNQKNLLCRVRLMSPLDYTRILSDYKKPVLDVVQDYFERKESLELPMYNKYFLLGLGSEEIDIPQPTKTEPEPEPEEEPKEEPREYSFMVGPGYGI